MMVKKKQRMKDKLQLTRTTHGSVAKEKSKNRSEKERIRLYTVYNIMRL